MKKFWLLPLFLSTAFAVQAADQPAPAPQKKQVTQQIYGYQLMTPEERTEYRTKMRSAKTPEERQQACEEHHAKMLERAKEKGVTLPAAPRCGAGRPGPRRGGGRGPGAGPGMGPGGGMGPGAVQTQ